MRLWGFPVRDKKILRNPLRSSGPHFHHLERSCSSISFLLLVYPPSQLDRYIVAEAVGLGAGVLTFITVAAKLSSATTALQSSIKDAPGDVQRVQTRLEDLEFILTQIDRARSMNPESVGDPATESYWNRKEAKLRSDFVEFGGFAAQLTANIGKAKGRIKWLLSHEDRAEKVLGLLAEDIDVLRALLGIMES